MPLRPDRDLSWRDRMASMRYARPLLGRAWETSPLLVPGTTLLRLIRALLPLPMVWVGKLILDAVVARITHKSGNLQPVWKLIVLERGLAVVSDIPGRVNTQLDLALFEDPVFYDKQERARRQIATGWFSFSRRPPGRSGSLRLPSLGFAMRNGINFQSLHVILNAIC
jgi:ATP-binding cassette, subfamily B, bacterial